MGKSLNDLRTIRSTWVPDVLVEGLVQVSVRRRCASMISFRLPTTLSDDIVVKPQFARKPNVRGSTPCVLPWYGMYANPSISNRLIPFVRS